MLCWSANRAPGKNTGVGGRDPGEWWTPLQILRPRYCLGNRQTSWFDGTEKQVLSLLFFIFSIGRVARGHLKWPGCQTPHLCLMQYASLEVTRQLELTWLRSNTNSSRSPHSRVGPWFLFPSLVLFGSSSPPYYPKSFLSFLIFS